MNAPNLDELQRLESEATPGPWKTHAPWSIGAPKQTGVSQVETKGFPATPAVCQTEADAALIVESRNALPLLLAELSASRQLLQAAQRKHEKTGFCPLCEAGPPPHHNEGCAVAAVRGSLNQEKQ